MKKRPFFSICTEVTNREKTIERTLRSISNQSFFDYEYVVVNNFSNDKSHDVISNYLRNDKVLDGKTEEFIMNSIRALQVDSTIVMIAHRMSTLRNCDKILEVRRNGQIIEHKDVELITQA